MKTDKKKLELWKRRLEDAETEYNTELSKMDDRERLYAGRHDVTGIVDGNVKSETPHVRNIVFELIESQVSSNIPQPKVTPMRKQDEGLAKIIEDMLRCELDRMRFEDFNDQMQRTVPLQGGGYYLCEWDSEQRTHTTAGEVSVSVLHPKKVIPQPGVYTGIEDMDYIFVKIPQTKELIKRRYGVDVYNETEDEPEIRGADGESAADDLVTQIIAYYRSDNGAVGMYSWVNEVQLADYPDYQARSARVCKKCGMEQNPLLKSVLSSPYGIPMDGSAAGEGAYGIYGVGGEYGMGLNPGAGDNTADGYSDGGYASYSGAAGEGSADFGLDHSGFVAEGAGDGISTCQYCGGKLENVASDYEILPDPENPMGTIRVESYKPGVFPVVLQKNVSVFGRLMGDSDADKLADAQNTTNVIEANIIDKLLTGGSYLILPSSASVKVNAGRKKEVRATSASDLAMIRTADMAENIQYDMAYLSQVYEEARQQIGITDSFQGRKDPTATSGKAKEFSAAQTAGRLESKRMMQNSAFAKLFELIFKFRLAYADEPRPVISTDEKGNRTYAEFNRMDFLAKDDAGQWYWNDRFLFSCDVSAPLASNREAMWQETRQNFQSGAFGDPTQIGTLILFWTKMELLHYPDAAQTKRYLMEEQIRQQEEIMRQQQMNRLQSTAAQSGMTAVAPGASSSGGMGVQDGGITGLGGLTGSGGTMGLGGEVNDAGLMAAIEELAKQAAFKTAAGSGR